ncbi:hypothetical protein ACFC0R_33905 [Streptomyces sp. NPDC056086]|uniref:hypothetical protein n=1 Tax=Streptomyces sp. NPDC056086 TaxID=3345709 RepID=UPI0035D93DE6
MTLQTWPVTAAELVAEHGVQWAAIDRWGHITGGMGPDPVTRAIKRISNRAGVPIA